jgi:hypothetical protein
MPGWGSPTPVWLIEAKGGLGHDFVFGGMSSEPAPWQFFEVMARPEFADVISTADRAGVILKVRHCGVRVKPVAVPDDNWPDVDDLPFVAAALATEARIIITLNPGDFEPASRHGLHVLSPAQAKREFL